MTSDIPTLKRSTRDLIVAQRRLTVLIDYLSQVKTDNFDIGSWGRWSDPPRYISDKTTETAFIKKVRDRSCGTTACVVGHAATIPAFRRAGLCLEPDICSDVVFEVIFNPPKSSQSYRGIDAAEQFFKLSFEDASYLFMPNSYHPSRRGRRAVINRLSQFTKKITTEIERRTNRCKKS